MRGREALWPEANHDFAVSGYDEEVVVAPKEVVSLLRLHIDVDKQSTIIASQTRTDSSVVVAIRSPCEEYLAAKTLVTIRTFLRFSMSPDSGLSVSEERN